MSKAAIESRSDPKRRAELAKIHVACKSLGLVGEEYRAFLKAITGLESAGAMDARQRGAVLDRLRALGFRSPKTSAANQRPGEPQERLAIAIWRDLGRLGVLKDPSDKGLRRFAAQVAGVDSLRWATPQQFNRVIEGLKMWRKREQEKRATVRDS